MYIKYSLNFVTKKINIMKTREIKFRAWNGEEMIYEGGKQFMSYRHSYEILQSYETVMQFTGLKDREAKEIYEGDIVRFKSGSATPINIIHKGKELTAYEPIFNIGCVVFYKGSFGLHNEFDTDSHLENSKYNGTSYYGNIQNNEYRMEVIGNIYENPELLNVNN